MQNIKEIVDKYLTDNWNEIQIQRATNPKFTWGNVASDVFEKTGCIVESEYLRNRNRKLIKKNFTNNLEGGKQGSLIPQTTTSTSNIKFQYLTGKENKEKGSKEWTFSADNIPTEQEIIDHFNIDTNKWKIVNIYHKTSFGGKFSITIQTNLLKGVETENYTEKFDKFIESYNVKILQNPKKDTKKKTGNNDFEQCAYLIGLADLHIGNYQRHDYIESIKDKVIYTLYNAAQFNIDEVILLNTGDLLHTDTSKAQTWNNTQLDAQDSFEDAFTNGLEFVTSIIDYARELGLKITFVNVRGNHSFDTEYCLGEAIKRVYKSDSKVNVLNSKDTRIYYKWNNNGFLFTHGDKGVERLPLLFATEGKEVFTQTEHHHIILGHLHHNKGKQFINDRGEFAGIEVRVLGSPTSNDIWHKQQGFCQNKKSVQCMMYTPKQGKFSEFNFKM